MFTKVVFKNYRALVDATLELSPITVLAGPNGSGKTSVIDAFQFHWPANNVLSSIPPLLPTKGKQTESLSVAFYIKNMGNPAMTRSASDIQHINTSGMSYSETRNISYYKHGGTLYAFNASLMRQPVTVSKYTGLTTNGGNLSGFLDYIRDNDADKFSALGKAIYKCTGEFDDIGFDAIDDGKKLFKLRRTGQRDFITASELSEGTLYIVAILALAFQPQKPALLCIEEPDRGLHPRLYREIRDVLHRLAYPDQYGETHAPVQIIATTHSPYFLNEFSPEQVVVCEKNADHSVTFRNLSKDPDAMRILGDSLIGDAWATGALGGVPTIK